MPLQSSVPPLEITATGVSVPDTDTVLGAVLSDYNTAFGGNLNVENVATPQGVLSADTTDYITAANAAITYMVNQVDPATAEGRMQDAIARIYFLYRLGATATVVAGLCTGAPGVTLPAGSAASDQSGNRYLTLGDVVFDPSGQATAQFACQVLGPVPCPAGSMTQIAQAVSGWDAVTNPAAGIPGTSVESRADFENRRYQSVAKNALGSPASIFGAVAEVPGVTDVYVIDNPRGIIVNSGSTSYPLAPHSVFVAAVGGSDQAVAEAIWTKKSTGCDYNGNTTATVTDTSSFAFPYPSYSVKFERPAALPIRFAVQIQASAALPANIISLTQAAILAAFTGADGGARARIASPVFASRYYAGVAAISPAVLILSILVGTSSPTANQVLVGIDQVPTLTASDISVSLI